MPYHWHDNGNSTCCRYKIPSVRQLHTTNLQNKDQNFSSVFNANKIKNKVKESRESLCFWDKSTHHMGTLCFFSTESRCDHPVLDHLSNLIHEEHKEEYQQLVLLVCSILYLPLLFASRMMDTCKICSHI